MGVPLLNTRNREKASGIYITTTAAATTATTSTTTTTITTTTKHYINNNTELQWFGCTDAHNNVTQEHNCTQLLYATVQITVRIMKRVLKATDTKTLMKCQ